MVTAFPCSAAGVNLDTLLAVFMDFFGKREPRRTRRST